MASRHLNLLLFTALLGLALGVGAFTFIYARGGSYLTDNPAACANCHVMNDHYDAWLKSSHRNVAVCNDCHTPAGFVAKYATKASNGFWHSVAFTTGDFPDPLRIRPHNFEVTEASCRKCHNEIVAAIEPSAHVVGTEQLPIPEEQLTCVRCHAVVGHWVR
jgi:cytochrome c nitrite reductase small subunit